MLTTILCILLLIMAVFLTVAVLMQHGKNHNLSGTIAGGAETFFGKTKGRSVDAMLSKITTIVAIIFVILVIIVYIIQPNDYNNEELNNQYADDNAVDGDVNDDANNIIDNNENAENENVDDANNEGNLEDGSDNVDENSDTDVIDESVATVPDEGAVEPDDTSAEQTPAE